MPRIGFRIIGGLAAGDYLFVQDTNQLYEGLVYQWLVNGTGVAGATLPHYTIQPSDVGKEIQCSVGRVRYLGTNCFDPDTGLLSCTGWLHPSLTVEC
jgi:hypothetical protein